MKKVFIEFIKRGSYAAAGGPIVIAVVYLILAANNVVTSISITKIAIEILTVTLMAFIAAGITAVYQIERLSVFSAALIHGVALYVDYILFYLLNGWLKNQIVPIAIFTVFFIVGYLIIWFVIYNITRKNIHNMNKKISSLSI